MWKKIIIIGVVLLALNSLRVWILSDDFQQWAVERDAQWTCRVNGFIAEFYTFMGTWEKAYKYNQYVLERCPKKKIAEKALFQSADLLQRMNQSGKAADVYREFAERYPKSKRADLAIRKLSSIGVRN